MRSEQAKVTLARSFLAPDPWLLTPDIPGFQRKHEFLKHLKLCGPTNAVFLQAHANWESFKKVSAETLFYVSPLIASAQSFKGFK